MSCPDCHSVRSLVSPNGLSGEVVCKTCGLVIRQARSSQGFNKWAPKWFANWSEDDSDTLREWLTTLRTVSCQLDLPTFPHREEAARMIRQESDLLFRCQRFGKNKREAVAALVHIVLRKYNEIRPLKEICKSLSLDHRLVLKYAWTMGKMTKTHRTLSAQEYLKKYGWKLTSDDELMQTAERLLSKFQRELSGNPVSLAAGAFYVACKSKKMKITKDEVGEAFHISGRTVYTNQRRINGVMSTRGFNSV